MERYDLLYRLYEEFDTESLRAYQEFVDLFPPVDSRVALNEWQDARGELDDRKDEIVSGFPRLGETFATIASHATRDQAFGALDLHSKYGRGLNVLVLDVDETLRSAGNTDNEIPRETLHLLTCFHETGTPIVICTGQTLENVKGFLIQGLGNELVHSGSVSIVYEAGTGVFTPGHGAETKRLLYEELDPEIRAVFRRVRSRILSEAPEEIRRGCHLQGNEFNVTLKPNFETGSEQADDVIDRGLVYLLDLVERSVVDALAEIDDDAMDRLSDGDDGGATGAPAGDESLRDWSADAPSGWARAYYAEADPEIGGVLDARDEHPNVDPDDVPAPVVSLFDRIDVAYYEADAAEVGSLELNKVVGVKSAFEVLGIDDPFALVMGDSKSDLRVMNWIDETDAGIAAAPDHSSPDVLDHVRGTDELVFDRGDAPAMLRTAFALNRLAELDERT
jgi:hydroxymethylpyrimidine pyrophosphatase-like HAD family hydrolase